jgi:hypothetical protein
MDHHNPYCAADRMPLDKAAIVAGGFGGGAIGVSNYPHEPKKLHFDNSFHDYNRSN